MTAVDEFTIEHLDQDWDVPCATKHATARRAEWLLTWACPCPPGSIVLCTSCKDGVVESPLIVCDDCHTQFKPGSSAARLIEPLNRRPQ